MQKEKKVYIKTTEMLLSNTQSLIKFQFWLKHQKGDTLLKGNLSNYSNYSCKTFIKLSKKRAHFLEAKQAFGRHQLFT